MLSVGMNVKEFELQDAYGKTHRLSDFTGKKKVIYFYPKDDTPGCTKQACAFRDSYQDFTDKDVIVIGISADSIESHKKFVEKYQLPFVLLSDFKHVVAHQFGTWVEKSMYGKTYMGMSRSTFILDENDVITHVFEKASPTENAQEILNIL